MRHKKSFFLERVLSSARIPRQTATFCGCLRLILAPANSLMFIDPHLDPSVQRYASVIDILLAARRPTVQPMIEVHRVCYEGAGRDRRIIDAAEWKSRFIGAWSTPLRAAHLAVEVFIWPDFHDRFLVTDLVGLSMSNGFDASNARGATITVTRLSRKDRDDVQKEFDPASNRLGQPRRFRIG